VRAGEEKESETSCRNEEGMLCKAVKLKNISWNEVAEPMLDIHVIPDIGEFKNEVMVKGKPACGRGKLPERGRRRQDLRYFWPRGQGDRNDTKTGLGPRLP